MSLPEHSSEDPLPESGPQQRRSTAAPTHSRSLIRFAGYLIFLLGTVFGALELAVRIFDPFGIFYVFETQRYFKLMEPNEDYAYIHKSDLDVELQGVRIRTNAEGFRGPNFAPVKPANKKRVILLGDSVVFSWGVKEEDTLPAQLQRLFDQSDSEVEIINVAVGSWNTRTQWEYMKKRGFDFGPDVIVHVVVNNDIQPKKKGHTAVPISKLFEGFEIEKSSLRKNYEAVVGYSYALSTVQRLFTMQAQTDEYMRSYLPQSPRGEDVKDAFTQLSMAAAERRVPLIGFLYGETETELGKVYQEFYGTLYRDGGLPLHLFPAELYESRFRNSTVDEHRNREGLALMAREIFHSLEREKAISAPAATGDRQGK